jgi:polysaccharide export outer membrane protein
MRPETIEIGVTPMKKNTRLLVFIPILLTALCSGALAAQQAHPKITEYTIGVGDILEIVTWKEPDFSREQILVRLDGKISFPLLDDVQAAGLTPVQLKKNIEAKLKEYVASPSVTVTIRDAASQKFYILGEVVHTGEYPLVKDLTVLQAFAVAGGFTEWASKKEIILFRRENDKEKVIRINYKDIIKGNDFSQNVKIKADDTIIVP